MPAQFDWYAGGEVVVVDKRRRIHCSCQALQNSRDENQDENLADAWLMSHSQW